MWGCKKKVWQLVGLFYIVNTFKTQPAGDTSEETVRSNMKVHRCHRLHTEKEERVMLSLVSAYLEWSLQCMPRLVSLVLTAYQVKLSVNTDHYLPLNGHEMWQQIHAQTF